MKRLALFVALLLPLVAFAQTSPPTAQPEAGSITFSASPTKGSGNVNVVLSWDVAPALDGTLPSSCQPSWQSAGVGASGSATLQVTKTTTYTLTCTWDDESAQVTWTPPTQNTDGSAIASTQLPLSYTVNSGASGKETVLKSGVVGPPYLVTGLTAGSTVCFTLNAVDATGAESAQSSEACKLTGTATANATASVTVTPVPLPPGGITVQ